MLTSAQLTKAGPAYFPWPSARHNPALLDHEMHGTTGEMPPLITLPPVPVEQFAQAVAQAYEQGKEAGQRIEGVRSWRYGVVCGLGPGFVLGAGTVAACIWLGRWWGGA